MIQIDSAADERVETSPNLTRKLQIQGESARCLLANLRDLIDDADDDMQMTAIEGETNLLEVIGEAVDRLAALEGMIDAIGTQQDKVLTRKARLANQALGIKAAINVAMSQAELRKLELPQATLSIRAVPPKLETPDESLIPAKFWKTKDPVLDRKAVLDALKAKEDVPGAVLSNGGETIAIKWG